MVHRLPEEQRALLELVAGFAHVEARPQAEGWEQRHTFPRPLFDQLAAMDLTDLTLGTDAGGSGLPFRPYLMVLEELARASVALGLGLCVHGVAASGIEAHASAEQRDRFLPDLGAGRRLGSYVLPGWGPGSDVAVPEVQACRVGEVYRLDGAASWVTHAGVADRYLVVARTGDGDGPGALSAFVIDADQPGLVASPPAPLIGLSASPTGQLVFEDAPVDADRLLGGAEGIGAAVALAALDEARLGIAACATGLAQAALDVALRHGRDGATGHRHGDQEGDGFLLADMAVRTEAARSLTLSAADRRDFARGVGPYASSGGGGFSTTKVAAMALVHATDAAARTATDAIRFLGADGCTTDHPVERYLREATVLRSLGGAGRRERTTIRRLLAEGR